MKENAFRPFAITDSSYSPSWIQCPFGHQFSTLLPALGSKVRVHHTASTFVCPECGAMMRIPGRVNVSADRYNFSRTAEYVDSGLEDLHIVDEVGYHVIQPVNGVYPIIEAQRYYPLAFYVGVNDKGNLSIKSYMFRYKASRVQTGPKAGRVILKRETYDICTIFRPNGQVFNLDNRPDDRYVHDMWRVRNIKAIRRYKARIARFKHVSQVNSISNIPFEITTEAYNHARAIVCGWMSENLPGISLLDDRGPAFLTKTIYASMIESRVCDYNDKLLIDSLCITPHMLMKYGYEGMVYSRISSKVKNRRLRRQLVDHFQQSGSSHIGLFLDRIYLAKALAESDLDKNLAFDIYEASCNALTWDPDMDDYRSDNQPSMSHHMLDRFIPTCQMFIDIMGPVVGKRALLEHLGQPLDPRRRYTGLYNRMLVICDLADSFDQLITYGMTPDQVHNEARALFDGDIEELHNVMATRARQMSNLQEDKDLLEFEFSDNQLELLEVVEQYEFRPRLPIDLNGVGADMGICVGGYAYRAAKKQITIVTAHKPGKHRPLACFELSGNKVVQAKLAYNSPVGSDDQLLKATKKWAQAKRLVLATGDLRAGATYGF